MVKLCFVVPALAVAVAAVTSSQWVEAVGLDVWNLPTLNAKIDSAEELDREYAAESEEVQHRIAVKEAIVDDLLAERCDLAAATARFAELNASRPQCMALIRAAHPGDTDEEKLARNVLSFCQSRVPPADRAAVFERLEAQLARMRSAR